MIPTNLKVIVYGNSLLLAGVTNVLQNRPGLELTRVSTQQTNSLGIKPPYPDVILFDLNSTEAKRVIPFLLKNDGIRLLGIDFSRGAAIELTRHNYPVQCSFDLVNLVTDPR